MLDAFHRMCFLGFVSFYVKFTCKGGRKALNCLKSKINCLKSRIGEFKLALSLFCNKSVLNINICIVNENCV